MTTLPHTLDDLRNELSAAGWTQQPTDTLHAPAQDTGIVFADLTHPKLGLTVTATAIDGELYPSIALCPQPQPAQPFPKWAVRFTYLPLSLVLAAADASADTSVQPTIFERLAAAGWTLADKTLKGTKVIDQRWASPDGERYVWWARYGRSQSWPGSWSVTWPGHGLGCPVAETGLDTPPAVIAALALTDVDQR